MLCDQRHIPYLLKSLEPIWAQWEQLGAALHIPHYKLENIVSNNQAVSCLDKLLKTISLFELKTPFEERIWKKVHKAVMDIDRVDIANKIEKDHDLNEPCKLYFNYVII